MAIGDLVAVGGLVYDGPDPLGQVEEEAFLFLGERGDDVDGDGDGVVVGSVHFRRSFLCVSMARSPRRWCQPDLRSLDTASHQRGLHTHNGYCELAQKMLCHLTPEVISYYSTGGDVCQEMIGL